MQAYRLKLALTWLVGGALIFLVMVLQSMLGKYEGETQAAWEWLLTNIVPTLTLVLGITTLTKPGTQASPEGVRSLFYISLAASIFYLLLLALPILLQPLVSATPLPFLRQSNLWLGPLQGVVTTLLGVFFTRENPAEKKRGRRPGPVQSET